MSIPNRSCERHPRLCNVPPCCRERPLKKWLHVPHPDFVPPSQYLRPPCEDVCCNHPVFEHRGYVPRCIRCSHFPPPQLRFNYSTEDGHTDPKSELATYETTTNRLHGQNMFHDCKGQYWRCQQETPRFLETSILYLKNCRL